MESGFSSKMKALFNQPHYNFKEKAEVEIRYYHNQFWCSFLAFILSSAIVQLWKKEEMEDMSTD